MPGTTPKYGLRYPVAADAPNVATDIQNLATDVDSKLGSVATPAGSGLWQPVYPAPSAAGASNLFAGIMWITRTVVSNVIQAIMVVTGTPVAAAKFRIGVYADSPTGPGALLWQSADIDQSVSGNKIAAFTFGPGAFWIAIQNVASANVSVNTWGGWNLYMPGVPTATPASGAPAGAWNLAGQGATLIDPFPAVPSAWTQTGFNAWLQGA